MSSDPANVDGAVANAALAYFTSRHRSGLLADAGPVFWVLLVGTLMILAIAAGTVAMTNNFRERALKSSQRELDNTGLLLARHFDRQIDDFESVQRSIATQLVKKIPSPEEFKRQLSTEEFHDQLKARINETADFAGVNIFDADGQFINSSERWPTPRINLSDRQYFKALRSGSAEGPVFIELVQSRVSEAAAKWMPARKFLAVLS